jgi:hypothetical protein
MLVRLLLGMHNVVLHVNLLMAELWNVLKINSIYVLQHTLILWYVKQVRLLSDLILVVLAADLLLMLTFAMMQSILLVRQILLLFAQQIKLQSSMRPLVAELAFVLRVYLQVVQCVLPRMFVHVP